MQSPERKGEYGSRILCSISADRRFFFSVHGTDTSTPPCRGRRKERNRRACRPACSIMSPDITLQRTVSCIGTHVGLRDAIQDARTMML
jgi:hypothetical protein